MRKLLACLVVLGATLYITPRDGAAGYPPPPCWQVCCSLYGYVASPEALCQYSGGIPGHTTGGSTITCNSWWTSYGAYETCP